MIKFSGEDRDTAAPLLGIGLTRENWDRMLAGETILFSTANMAGLPPITVCITAGDDDQALAESILAHGVEQVHNDPSLAEPYEDKEVRPADLKGVN